MQLFTNPLAAMTAAQPVRAADTSGDSGSSGSSSGTSAATITANDFLQLLVTELQNQDPTANTDPNEYIDQLVQVNSLEQLIQINQNTTPSSTTTGTGDVAGAPATAASFSGSPVTGPAQANSAAAGPGNLSVPANNGASSRIADALGVAAQTLSPGSGSSPIQSLLHSVKARAQQARTSLSNPAQ